jgi:hypothetical protein
MANWDPDRDRQGRFQPGSGGRPPGARNRTGRKLREALERSLDLHMADALRRVSCYEPAVYVRLLLQAFPVGSEDGETRDDLPSGEGGP